MFRLRCWKFCALVWAAAALFSVGLGVMGSRAQPLRPTQLSPWGFITLLRTLENADALSVTMDTALAGCDPGNEYQTIPDDEKRKLQHAVLLGAFLNHKRVRITTRLCAGTILAVDVRDD